MTHPCVMFQNDLDTKSPFSLEHCCCDVKLQHWIRHIWVSLPSLEKMCVIYIISFTTSTLPKSPCILSPWLISSCSTPTFHFSLKSSPILHHPRRAQWNFWKQLWFKYEMLCVIIDWIQELANESCAKYVVRWISYSSFGTLAITSPVSSCIFFFLAVWWIEFPHSYLPKSHTYTKKYVMTLIQYQFHASVIDCPLKKMIYLFTQ